MVRLEEVEDESFVEKPESSKDDVLLMDDDADYTDTGMPHHLRDDSLMSCDTVNVSLAPQSIPVTLEASPIIYIPFLC